LRQIGTLPKGSNGKVFGDHLLAMGVTSRLVESPDGWAVWVHNEDLVPKAREELTAYLADPHDGRFGTAEAAAQAARREADLLDRQYRRNVRAVPNASASLNARRRPLTLALVAACVLIYLARDANPFWVDNWLGFFPMKAHLRADDYRQGLDAIVGRGEVWRLFTPALIHLNLMHLVFNCWATLVEGTIIEYRRGTRVLATLVVVSAAVSNVGQYVWGLAFYGRFGFWGGISGVAYALFGYLWMKGRMEPEQGMVLTPQSVRLMLIWLLFGLSGILPIANGAHVFGLLVGMLFGLARF